ncbi:hypothetical protein ABZS66_51855 [Dactylosporangium sp. NPDC005572]|uniref:hypothetical protein n=1 Tax=Dactylosporangium sp. NPDC005572 TaxID=3156889 RepID=UPI0033A0FA0B
MSGGRWWRRLPVVAVVLIGAVLVVGRAEAAPCTGVTCYRYWADITMTAALDPPTPILPGELHGYTVRVTNTGWRTGGLSAPVPYPGPDSGLVVVGGFGAPDEVPVAYTVNSGVPFNCRYIGPSCGVEVLPSGASGEFTFIWRAPRTPGTYTIRLWIDSYQWTEYDETNNSLTLTYEVTP